MKRIIFVLFLATSSFVFAQDKHYFEPTCSEWDTDHTAIMAQQKSYEHAKANGDWDGAMANALFYFQKAWLEFNLGNRLESSGDDTGARAHYEAAKENCEQEEVCDVASGGKPAGRHAAEQKKCLKHVLWHLKHLGEKK